MGSDIILLLIVFSAGIGVGMLYRELWIWVSVKSITVQARRDMAQDEIYEKALRELAPEKEPFEGAEVDNPDKDDEEVLRRRRGPEGFFN